MNKIDQLLKKYCPDGVEWAKLGDIAEIGTGNSNRSDAKIDGKYSLYVRSKDILKTDKFEYDDESILVPGEGGIGEIFHYVNGKYALHQRVYRIHIIKNNISHKFLYYIFVNCFKSYIQQKVVSATVTSLRKPMFDNFEIPLIPLKIQNKIVEILDNFSELEAELEFRNIQYEYYNNKLLDFDNNQSLLRKLINDDFLNKEVKTYKLSEISKITTGQFITKNSLSDFGLYCVYNGSNKPIGKFDKYNAIKYSSTIVRCGSAGVVNFLQDNAWVSDNSYIVEVLDNNFLSPKYLNYFLQGNQKFLKEKNNLGSVPRLPKSVLENFEIKVPSIEIQNRIVRVLEKLETYNKDVNTGLPAEVNARKSQYDYYLNKLLTFKTGGGQ